MWPHPCSAKNLGRVAISIYGFDGLHISKRVLYFDVIMVFCINRFHEFDAFFAATTIYRDTSLESAMRERARCICAVGKGDSTRPFDGHCGGEGTEARVNNASTKLYNDHGPT